MSQTTAERPVPCERAKRRRYWPLFYRPRINRAQDFCDLQRDAESVRLAAGRASTSPSGDMTCPLILHPKMETLTATSQQNTQRAARVSTELSHKIAGTFLASYINQPRWVVLEVHPRGEEAPPAEAGSSGTKR